MKDKNSTGQNSETTPKEPSSTTPPTSTSKEGTSPNQTPSSSEVPTGGILGDETPPAAAAPNATETPSETPEDSKAASETPAPVAEVFEPYELELSEESPISDDELQEIAEFAEKMKLSKTEAENLIKMRENSHEAAQKHFEQMNAQKVTQMMQDFKAESSLHTPENKNYMKTAVNAFGKDPEFTELFKDPAMNFNIPLAKFLINVGKKISEVDTSGLKVKSSTFSGPKKDSLAEAADRMYPNM